MKDQSRCIVEYSNQSDKQTINDEYEARLSDIRQQAGDASELHGLYGWRLGVESIWYDTVVY